MNVFRGTFQSFQTSLSVTEHIFKLYSPALLPSILPLARRGSLLVGADADHLSKQSQGVWPRRSRSQPTPPPPPNTALLRLGRVNQSQMSAQKTHGGGEALGGKEQLWKKRVGRMGGEEGEEGEERLELIGDQWRKDESGRPRGGRAVDLG